MQQHEVPINEKDSAYKKPKSRQRRYLANMQMPKNSLLLTTSKTTFSTRDALPLQVPTNTCPIFFLHNISWSPALCTITNGSNKKWNQIFRQPKNNSGGKLRANKAKNPVAMTQSRMKERTEKLINIRRSDQNSIVETRASEHPLLTDIEMYTV